MSKSKNPIAILKQMMALPFCHMHGPEHHVMVGAAPLTAYKNAGRKLELYTAIAEMMNRGQKFPAEPVVFGEPAAQEYAQESLYLLS